MVESTLEVVGALAVVTGSRITSAGQYKLKTALTSLFDRGSREPDYKQLDLTPGSMPGRSLEDYAAMSPDELATCSQPSAEQYLGDEQVMRVLASRFGEPEEKVRMGTSDTYLLPVKLILPGRYEEQGVVKKGFAKRSKQECRRRICGTIGLNVIGLQDYLNIISYDFDEGWSLELYRPDNTSRLAVHSKDPKIWEKEIDDLVRFSSEVGFLKGHLDNPDSQRKYALEAFYRDALTTYWYLHSPKAIEVLSPRYRQRKFTQLQLISEIAKQRLDNPAAPVTVFFPDFTHEHVINVQINRQYMGLIKKYTYDQGQYAHILRMDKFFRENPSQREHLDAYKRGKRIPTELYTQIRETSLNERDMLNGMSGNMFISLGQLAMELTLDRFVDRGAVDYLQYLINKGTTNGTMGDANLTKVWGPGYNERQMHDERVFWANWGAARKLIWTTTFSENKTYDANLEDLIRAMEVNQLAVTFLQK